MATLMLAALEQSDAPFYLFFGWIGFLLFLGLLALAGSVFWLWMLVDAIRNPRLDDMEKLVWALVIFFLHFVGAVVYFFAGRKKPPDPSRT